MADSRYRVSHVASIKTATLGESWESDIHRSLDQAFGFVPRNFFRLGSIAEHQPRHSNDVAVGCESACAMFQPGRRRREVIVEKYHYVRTLSDSLQRPITLPPRSSRSLNAFNRLPNCHRYP